MKTATATDIDKIEVIAELDGWKEYNGTFYPPSKNPAMNIFGHKFPNYLTSYDAILPVIQKQTAEVKYKAAMIVGWSFESTPLQLADALLIATGKMML